MRRSVLEKARCLVGEKKSAREVKMEKKRTKERRAAR